MDYKKMLSEIVGELVSRYITKELLDKLELAAKKMAVDKLGEFAASTDWTEIDDKLVKKISQAWGL